MLSIIITIYNYNLFPLVKELVKQCDECNIKYEILAQDDASKSPFNIENRKINTLPNCQFNELEINVGLRENKNLLAQKAQYPYLLILDGDCILPSSNFIKKYIENIEDNDGVHGGRIHAEKAPSPQQSLRWKYGKFMEDQSVENRMKNPYRLFLFNNTLIKKETFDKIKFDNTLKKYGHDDTLFSFELKKLNAKIKHINNPVVHDDIDTNIVFFNKMKGSLENLYYLYTHNKIEKNHSKLILLVEQIQKLHLQKPIIFIYNSVNKFLEKNLTGNHPKLFFFNVFRLGYFLNLYKD